MSIKHPIFAKFSDVYEKGFHLCFVKLTVSNDNPKFTCASHKETY